MRWRSNMSERKSYLSKRTKIFSKNQNKLSPNRQKWSSLMRQIEPSGIRKRVSYYQLRKTQCQSKNLCRERMTICWKRLRDSRNRIREISGSTRSQWMLVRWKLTIKCSTEWAVVCLTGSTLEAQVKVFRSLMAKVVSRRVRISAKVRIDLVMVELIRVWIISNLVSSRNLVHNLVWEAKINQEACHSFPYLIRRPHQLELLQVQLLSRVQR